MQISTLSSEVFYEIYPPIDDTLKLIRLECEYKENLNHSTKRLKSWPTKIYFKMYNTSDVLRAKLFVSEHSVVRNEFFCFRYSLIEEHYSIILRIT